MKVSNEEQGQWLRVFMPLYEQVAPLIRDIAKLDTNNQPADLSTLLEGGQKLPPILESVKKMPKPKQKELRSIKQEFEKVLHCCIKASESGAILVDSVALRDWQITQRMRFSNIIVWTIQAQTWYKSLSKKLDSLHER